MPYHEDDVSRHSRAVQALVQLFRRANVTDIDTVDETFKFVAEPLSRFFARQRLQQRSRGVLSILGIKKRRGEDWYDKHLDEPDAECPMTEEQRRETKMIGRFERFAMLWGFWRFFIQVYIFLAVTFRICFEIARDPASWALELLIVDTTSWLTIAFRFFEIIEEKGQVSYDPARRRQQYLRSWFGVDLIGALPLDFIGLAVGSKCTLRFNRCGFLTPYWQLNRLINCRGMFDTFADLLEDVLLRFSIHPYLARVVSSFLNFLGIAHLLACLLYLIYVVDPDAFQILFRLTPEEDIFFPDHSTFFQYVSCVDWAAKNLVGLNKGDSFPDSDGQFMFNFCVSLVGVSLFAVVLAVIANWVSRPSPEAEFGSSLDELIDFLGYRKFPDDIRADCIAYSKHKFEYRPHLLEHHEILSDLPTSLLDKVLLAEGESMLAKVPLFAPHVKNKRFVISLREQLVPLVLHPGTVVFRYGDHGDAMYFNMLGTLGVIADDDPTNVKFEIHPGGFVGEIALLMEGPRTATVAVTGDRFCNLLMLSKRRFERLSSLFPQIFRCMQIAARDRFLELNRGLFEHASEIGRKSRQGRLRGMVAAVTLGKRLAAQKVASRNAADVDAVDEVTPLRDTSPPS